MRTYPTEKLQQDGRRGKNHFWNQTPLPPETLRGLKQTLCALEPRDSTETETELYLSISCGGPGQQWSAAGAGALGAADMGMAQALLEEVTSNSIRKLPELTQDWEKYSWRAQTEPCAPEPRRKEQ